MTFLGENVLNDKDVSISVDQRFLWVVYWIA